MSRRKSAGSKLGRRALLAGLLRQGERFVNPGAEVLQASAKLQALGLIQLRHGKAVVCANPNDRDFPPRDPDCRGIIELDAGADEGGGDYACPVCDRIVYPTLKGKEQCELLTVTVDQQGIERFVLTQFGAVDPELVFERGVLVVPGRPHNRFISIVDFCTDPAFLDRGWIETQPCIYIVVDPRVRLHLGGANHAHLVELADLLCESGPLSELLNGTSRMDPYAGLSVPEVRTRRAEFPRSELDERRKTDASHRFAVGLHDSGIVVEGIVIERDSSALPYLSFSEIMQQAALDVGSAREIMPLKAREIAERIEEKLPGTTIDPDGVQKALKRLDRSIVERLKQAGAFIGEGDVIENVARAGKYRGKHGFRLNSDKVLLGAKASTRAGLFETAATMSDSARPRRKSRL